MLSEENGNHREYSGESLVGTQRPSAAATRSTQNREIQTVRADIDETLGLDEATERKEEDSDVIEVGHAVYDAVIALVNEKEKKFPIFGKLGLEVAPDVSMAELICGFIANQILEESGQADLQASIEKRVTLTDLITIIDELLDAEGNLLPPDIIESMPKYRRILPHLKST